MDAGRVALKVGFLALVTAFGMFMKFLVALKNDPDLQAKLIKVLMYVGLIIVAAIAIQLLAAAALAALSFLVMPALIIAGIVAALFAFQYYFKEELDTFVDYLRAALEPIGKVLDAIGNFATKTVPHFFGLLWKVVLSIKKSIQKISIPELPNIPFMANGGVSKGGMTVVGERGPELVNLSKGSRVFSNSESRKMVSSSDTVNNFNITINAKDTSKAEMRRIANELGNMINNKMNRTGATRTMR